MGMKTYIDNRHKAHPCKIYLIIENLCAVTSQCGVYPMKTVFLYHIRSIVEHRTTHIAEENLNCDQTKLVHLRAELYICPFGNKKDGLNNVNQGPTRGQPGAVREKCIVDDFELNRGVRRIKGWEREWFEEETNDQKCLLWKEETKIKWHTLMITGGAWV